MGVQGEVVWWLQGTIDEDGDDDNDLDPVVFEFVFDLRSDGSGDAPGVVWMDEALRAEVFGKEGQKLEDVYPIERYPLIWLPCVRVLLCRHGQMYCPVDGRKKAEAMEVKTFRLRALFVTRARYPFVRLSSCGKRSIWACHNLMGWACFGDRPEGLVNDHKGQDNKQDSSEKYLEYVSPAENSQRYYDFTRRGGEVVSEAVRGEVAKVVARVAPTIKVPGSGSRSFTSNAPVTPDGGDLVVDRTADVEPEPIAPTGPSGPPGLI